MNRDTPGCVGQRRTIWTRRCKFGVRQIMELPPPNCHGTSHCTNGDRLYTSLAHRSMENDADLDMLDAPPPLQGPPRHLSSSAYDDSKVLIFINNTIDNINAALSVWPHDDVNVVLKRVKDIEHQRGTVNNASVQHDQTRKNAKVKVSCRQMKYSWPGKTPDEAWRFSMIPSHNP